MRHLAEEKFRRSGLHPPGQHAQFSALNKAVLIQQIITALEAELEGYARSARSAHAEATDEQSKAENKYDTRGLEASYLARGQSRQAAETMEALQHFQKLVLREFGPGEAIDVGALVELEDQEGRSCYFLGPRAGGIEIRHGRKTVLVITPQSPLGRQLIGRKEGEKIQLQMNRASRACRVIAVT
jgi:transcription elongation GreA/GreB family factor